MARDKPCSNIMFRNYKQKVPCAPSIIWKSYLQFDTQTSTIACDKQFQTFWLEIISKRYLAFPQQYENHMGDLEHNLELCHVTRHVRWLWFEIINKRYLAPLQCYGIHIGDSKRKPLPWHAIRHVQTFWLEIVNKRYLAFLQKYESHMGDSTPQCRPGAHVSKCRVMLPMVCSLFNWCACCSNIFFEFSFALMPMILQFDLRL